MRHSYIKRNTHEDIIHNMMQKYTRHCECLVLLQMYNDTETIFRDLLTYINDYKILEYFCPLSHFGKTTVFNAVLYTHRPDIDLWLISRKITAFWQSHTPIFSLTASRLLHISPIQLMQMYNDYGINKATFSMVNLPCIIQNMISPPNIICKCLYCQKRVNSYAW